MNIWNIHWLSIHFSDEYRYENSELKRQGGSKHGRRFKTRTTSAGCEKTNQRRENKSWE